MYDPSASWAPEIGVEDLFVALGHISPKSAHDAARATPDPTPAQAITQPGWWASRRRRAAAGLHLLRAACGSVVASRGQSQAKRPT
jgi:hypothetical protein